MVPKIFIVSGPVGSGKTTRLVDWAITQKATGIATPVIMNKRMFMDLSSMEIFSMESHKPLENDFKIGKYIFSKASFDKAEKILRIAVEAKPDFLIIDEIGPLEISGKGFDSLLKEFLKNEKRNYNLVLVIRESLLETVLTHYHIEKYESFKPGE